MYILGALRLCTAHHCISKRGMLLVSSHTMQTYISLCTLTQSSSTASARTHTDTACSRGSSCSSAPFACTPGIPGSPARSRP